MTTPHPTPTPLASTAMEAAREIGDPIPCGYDVFGSVVRYRQPDENDRAAIISRHFQPLLAKVEGERDTAKQALLARIQEYLCNGGLFNPEMAEHEKVRELIMDMRDFLSVAPRSK